MGVFMLILLGSTCGLPPTLSPLMRWLKPGMSRLVTDVRIAALSDATASGETESLTASSSL